ncbi:MAG: hypothetical protein IPH35_00750 [Rhodoferax sp.]|nr:hypothetical protein [Rhodoferax sp.]
MYTIRKTPEFETWFSEIRETMARKRLGLRLRKAEVGNLGDVRPVGEGVNDYDQDF